MLLPHYKQIIANFMCMRICIQKSRCFQRFVGCNGTINYSMDVLIICCRELFFFSPYLISIIAVILKCCYGNNQLICMLGLIEPMAFMLIYKRYIVERTHIATIAFNVLKSLF